MAATFVLNHTFWANDDIKHLTFNGNDVDELTINGNAVLLPLDFTATLKSLNSTQTITFPTTKSKLARGLLIHCNAKKIGSTAKATFTLSYTNGSSTYSRTIYTINKTSPNTEDILLNLWYNGDICMLGGGSTLPNWASAYQGGTYLNLKITGVSNLTLNESLTIRVVSDWTSHEEEDTSTTTTTTVTTAAANADANGFTLIDE